MEFNGVVIGELLVFALIYIVFLIVPWLRCPKSPVSVLDATEWERGIDARIGALTSETIDEFTETNRDILRQILTESPGRVRTGAMERALSLLAESVEHRARALRSLGSISVLLGLAFSVFHLCIALWRSNLDMKELAKQGLWLIYGGNALFIGTAVVLAFLAYSAKQRGSEFLLRVSRSFARLSPDEVSTDPAIKRALDDVAVAIRDWLDESQRANVDRVQRLLDEVKSLAAGIQSLAESMLNAAQGSQDDVLTQIVAVEQRLETVSQRLDEGFKLLAQPFLQGIPAFDRLAEVSGRLGDTIEALERTEFSAVMARVATASESIERSVDALAPRIEASLGGVGTAVREGARVGLTEAVEPEVAKIINEVRAIKDPALAILTVNRSVVEAGDAVRSMATDVSRDLRAVGDVVRRLGSEFGSAVSSQLQDLQVVRRSDLEAAVRISQDEARGLREELRSMKGAIESSEKVIERIGRTLAPEPQPGWLRRKTNRLREVFGRRRKDVVDEA